MAGNRQKREGNDDKYGGWTKCSGEGNTNVKKECSKLGRVTPLEQRVTLENG